MHMIRKGQLGGINLENAVEASKVAQVGVATADFRWRAVTDLELLRSL